MTDTDLRALERATQRAPDDGSAWLARALGAARVGAKEEALEAFYRAAALGADLVPVREGLRALGAPATPWGHEAGDSKRTRCSPLRGPRKGEIVARAPLPKENSVVIAEDGTVLVGQSGGTIARFEGRTLAPLPDVQLDGTWAKVWPSAGAGLVVATTSGSDSGLYVVSGTKVRCVEVPGPEKKLAEPVIVGGRAVVVSEADESTLSVHALDADFERLARFAAGSFAQGVAADSERIVFLDASGRNYATLNVLTWSGARRLALPLADAPREEPVLDALGRVLLVTEQPGEGDTIHHVSALDVRGETPWRHTFRSHEAGEVSVVAAKDGAVYVATETELARIERDGALAWSDDRWDRGRGALCDRDGVFYGTLRDRERSALVAVAPDRTELFALERPSLRPVAIDAWGRLLAVHRDEIPAKGELVAIA